MFEFILLGLAFWIAWSVIKTYQDDQLLRSNPDAWREKMALDADARERRRKAMGQTALRGLSYARGLLKR